jgi:hypothetical protein
MQPAKNNPLLKPLGAECDGIVRPEMQKEGIEDGGKLQAPVAANLETVQRLCFAIQHISKT